MAIVIRKINKPYIGDVGTVILLDCLNDITDATNVEIHVQKPDGTEVIWPGTIVENTKIKYVIVVDDLDQAGEWWFQAYVESTAGKWRGEAVKQIVYEKFKK